MEDRQRQISPYLSLKWKSLLTLSLVLALVNGGFAYLVFEETTDQFESEQAQKRLIQARELTAALSQGFESMSTFAAFIPRLSVSASAAQSADLRSRIAAVLDEHGFMLDVEWGVKGVHYFVDGRFDSPVVSWPSDRYAPDVTGLLHLTDLEEAPQGRILCETHCIQLVALPLLHDGRTSGYLLVERLIGDSLREFHLLSGGDIAILMHALEALDENARTISSWSVVVPAVTRNDQVLPVLQMLASRHSLKRLLDRPLRIEHAGDWYEVFAMPAASTHPGLIVLGMNRVTSQVHGIREAITDSVILGVSGLVLSEVFLLVLLWGPMQRIQDVVQALPLFAEKAFSRLRYELPMPPKDGRLRDEIDVMVHTLASVSEQVERLDLAHANSEQALRESEQVLKLAQSMARVASWTGLPLEGCFEITQGAERIDPALLDIGKWSELIALVHPEDRRDLHLAWRRARAGSVLDREFRLVIDDREIDIHVMAEFGIVGKERKVRALGMIQDVSEARTVQRMLREHRDRLEQEVQERTAELVTARNAAQKLARAKGEFLANMSHEIRTPLSAILGLSQIGMKESYRREISSIFEQILDAGEHLLNVVNDVLDHAKLEAGKLVIAFEPFDLRRVVMQCVEMLRMRAEAKGLEMTVNVADALPDWVAGDRFRLQQILLNLLSNAVKFSEHGGIQVDVYREASYTCFRVSDSGVGMSSAQVADLFRPYHQVSDSAASRSQGTGLGLSISHTLAVMMEGDIRVRSRLGQGSEFVLRLPLEERQLTSPPALPGSTPVPQKHRLAGMRILVADDVAINRTVLESQLVSEGAEIVSVADGKQVLVAACGVNSQPFDVILMDIQMPELDGHAATRRLRDAGIQTPVIGISAFDAAEQRELALASGMTEQLVKPVMPDELVEILLSVKGVGVSDPGSDAVA